jgi:uncharacterized protein YukE
MDKLTTKELEERIDQYRQRASTLQDIIADIRDTNAKAALQSHIESYQTTVDQLRAELSRRLKK